MFLRARPYISYAERTKMRYDAVDRTFYDAIIVNLKTPKQAIEEINDHT